MPIERLEWLRHACMIREEGHQVSERPLPAVKHSRSDASFNTRISKVNTYEIVVLLQAVN